MTQRGSAATARAHVIPKRGATRNLALRLFWTRAQSEIPRFVRIDRVERLVKKAEHATLQYRDLSMRFTVECVPNFSEGLNAEKVNAIRDSIAGTPGVAILDVTMDPDHNRSVITFAGTPSDIGEAALKAIGRAAALIDLNQHKGVHPRIGAADVVPFVPLAGTSLAESAAIARFVAEQAWLQFGVPTYLYEAAAKNPKRRALESVRKGGFETLREAVKVDPERRPDFGGLKLHPTAGATVVGARGFLAAFNVNLAGADVEAARAIARRVRGAGGGLSGVKALGLYLPSRRLAQVSMNLTDLSATRLRDAFEAVEREAHALGAEVYESEIVGLVPREALRDAPLDRMKIRDFARGVVLEDRLAELAGAAPQALSE